MNALKAVLLDMTGSIMMESPGIVYAIKNPFLPGMVKIGMSKYPIEKRLKYMSTPLPGAFEVVATAKVFHARAAERVLHEHFAAVRVNKGREFFWMTEEDAKAAIALCGEMLGQIGDPARRLLLAHHPMPKKRKTTLNLEHSTARWTAK